MLASAEVMIEHRQMFRAFKRSAFRLEALPQYLVESEQESFAQYKAGQPLSPPRESLERWAEIIVANVSAGKSMQRIHVLPSTLTPYLRFEIEWGYTYTATAGEDIRLLLPNAPSEAREQGIEDFWLFDDEVVFFPRYDHEGRFLGAEKSLDSSVVEHCRRTRDVMLPHAVTLRDYLVSIRNA